MVEATGIEPARVSPLDSKSSASASSAMPPDARNIIIINRSKNKTNIIYLLIMRVRALYFYIDNIDYLDFLIKNF